MHWEASGAAWAPRWRATGPRWFTHRQAAGTPDCCTKSTGPVGLPSAARCTGPETLRFHALRSPRLESWRWIRPLPGCSQFWGASTCLPTLPPCTTRCMSTWRAVGWTGSRQGGRAAARRHALPPAPVQGSRARCILPRHDQPHGPCLPLTSVDCRWMCRARSGFWAARRWRQPTMKAWRPPPRAISRATSSSIACKPWIKQGPQRPRTTSLHRHEAPLSRCHSTEDLYNMKQTNLARCSDDY